jgi:hypothetical protein
MESPLLKTLLSFIDNHIVDNGERGVTDKTKEALKSTTSESSIITGTKDSLEFLSMLPDDILKGAMSTSATDPEIILRWYDGKHWLNVHFEGTRTYEYAYIQDGKFVGGLEIGNLDKPIPSDLNDYLLKFTLSGEKNYDR